MRSLADHQAGVRHRRYDWDNWHEWQNEDTQEHVPRHMAQYSGPTRAELASPAMQTARVLGAIGRVLISAGVLVLLFVVYQLWGTGIQEARAQHSLENEFEEVLANAGVEAGTEGATTATTAPPATTPPPSPPEGDAVAHLQIPDIGVDKIVVEGVGVGDLKRGPGHYPGSPLPGQAGNAAIAGHRTTYGAPFFRLDELEQGAEILVTTQQGSFRYEVFETQIVDKSQTDVLNEYGDNRLTLTACHPKYSARQRIVVVAELSGPALPSNPAGQVSFEDISGGGGLITTILYGLLCASIWLFAWALGRVWRKWPAYLVGLPFFMVGLFYFFEEFSQVLPSNY